MCAIEIDVSPSLAVMDEVVAINITGLLPNSAVTVSAKTTQRNVDWLAFGHFYADEHGRIDVTNAASHGKFQYLNVYYWPKPNGASIGGGSYTGVLEMGLFTSMTSLYSKTNGNRFVVTGSAETIVSFDIQVWKGHQSRDALHTLNSNSISCDTDVSLPTIGGYYRETHLAETKCRRTYMHPDVVRIPVRDEVDGTKIRGVLFLPSSVGGPFPAVIDTFGGVAGCVEFRAALLAKHGFAAFALAYLGYQDLGVNSAADIQLTYFSKAITWLLRQSSVDNRLGVGMIGVCLGTYFVLNTAIEDSRVRAAICINPAWHMSPGLTTNVFSLTKEAAVKLGMCPPGGSHMIREGMLTYRPDAPRTIPRPMLHHKHDHPILFLISEHDESNPAILQTDELMEQLKRSGKKNVSRVVIGKHGHLLEPPYAPMCTATTSGRRYAADEEVPWFTTRDAYLELINWGGDMVNHERDQMHAWQVMLRFLRSSMGLFTDGDEIPGRSLKQKTYNHAKL